MYKLWKFIFVVEILIALTVWLAVLDVVDDKFHLTACDVGQGDAILAIYQNTQVLIDGGPDRKVLDCLGKHMPFWDKTIELVILTHPEKDHYGGLIDVFKRYEVGVVLLNNLDISSPDYQVLESLVGGSGARVVRPLKGQHIRLGMMYLDIFNPDSNLKKELNLNSIVTELHFKSFVALLMGDMENFSFGEIHKVQYIKVPHHGSKNGLTSLLVKETNPDLAVISVGKNSYGHPHQEILQMLTDAQALILRTDKLGDIEVVSDGVNWQVR